MDGRHAARYVWAPATLLAMTPWAVVLSGLAVMMVIFVVAAGRVHMDTAAIGEQPGATPAVPNQRPRPPAVPPPMNTGGQLAAIAPPPAGEATLAPAPPPTTTPPPPPSVARPPDQSPSTAPAPSYRGSATVQGRYRVLAEYGESFIAEVLVVNFSREDRDWKVTLRFPDNVGRMHTAWVEGAPQASISRSDRDYVFTSGVPVPGWSSVPLRFQFERYGRGAEPSVCTVNGGPCAIH